MGEAARNEENLLREKIRSQKIETIRLQKKAATAESCKSTFSGREDLNIEVSGLTDQMATDAEHLQAAQTRNTELERDSAHARTVAGDYQQRLFKLIRTLRSLLDKKSTFKGSSITENTGSSESMGKLNVVDVGIEMKKKHPVADLRKKNSELRQQIHEIERNLQLEKDKLGESIQKIQSAIAKGKNTSEETEKKRVQIDELKTALHTKKFEIASERAAKLLLLEEERENLARQEHNYNIILADLNMKLEKGNIHDNFKVEDSEVKEEFIDMIAGPITSTDNLSSVTDVIVVEDSDDLDLSQCSGS